MRCALAGGGVVCRAIGGAENVAKDVAALTRLEIGPQGIATVLPDGRRADMQWDEVYRVSFYKANVDDHRDVSGGPAAMVITYLEFDEDYKDGLIVDDTMHGFGLLVQTLSNYLPIHPDWRRALQTTDPETLIVTIFQRDNPAL